jgi:predicted enzyme related to lactoylglutathione lyase
MRQILLIAFLSIFVTGISYAQKQSERKTKMPEATEFALTKVGQISIVVKDLARATVFYRDNLGLKHLHQAPSVSIFDCGGITLLLSLPEKENDGPSSVIYFDVSEIQPAFQALSARGVEFIGQPHVVGKLGKIDVWVAIFRDSEGNMMGLRSMVASQ